MSRSDVLVGRQPIFDRGRNVHGYELVLRPREGVASRPDVRGAAEDGALLTSHVLFSSLHVGVDRFVGDKLMFCDVNEELLTGDIALLLPPERTVLEIPTGALYGSFAVSGARRLLVVRGRRRDFPPLLVREARPPEARARGRRRRDRALPTL
jgi:EAL and modified HD-GYP domain-containing signal transduction protein